MLRSMEESAIRAMPEGQAEIFQLAEKLCRAPIGPHGYVDGRTGAAREWHRHQMAVMRVRTDLIEAGPKEIIIPADGMHPTCSGRAMRHCLAGHDARTRRCAALRQPARAASSARAGPCPSRARSGRGMRGRAVTHGHSR